MRLQFGTRQFEIDEKELSRLATEEYKRLMAEQERKGFITLDFGLFGVLDGFFGADDRGRGIPRCMACGSYDDYTMACRYHSAVKVIKENGKEKDFCRKEDVPIRKLIDSGKLDKYEVKNAQQN